MMQPERLKQFMLNQHRKWEHICHCMERLEEEPMLLVTDIFKGGDLYLAERLKQQGEEVLTATHEYWMQYLLPALSDYFSMDEVTLLYEEGVPLSPIYIQIDGQIAAQFSPYWRVFETYGVPGKEELLEKRRQRLTELEKLQNEIQDLYTLAENPAVMAEDDTWGYAKAIVNPNKHKKKMQELIDELEPQIDEIEIEIRQLNNQLAYAEQSYLEIDYCLDRVKRKVERWGDFTFIEPQEEEDE